MKILIFTLLALCLVAVCRSAEEEYDYEEEPSAPVVTPAPAKPAAGRLGGLLASRGRAPVGKKPVVPPAQSTTAKPVEQPVEDVEQDAEELEEEEEVPTTTTETPKNLVRGGVRPFRSNEDLLAALKRRRAQAPTKDSHTTHAPVEATTKNNKASSANRPKSTNEGRSSSRGRFASSRAGNKQQVQEEVEETQQEEVQVKPKPYRRG